MITELESDSFPSVLPLYRSSVIRFPLIAAVIEQKQRGQVFVDKCDAPEAAFVVTDFGFTYLFESRQNGDFDAALAQLLSTPNALKPGYLLWYSPPDQWQTRFDALGNELARRRGRIRFEFGQEQAKWLNEEIETPTGFELQAMSAELIPSTE